MADQRDWTAAAPAGFDGWPVPAATHLALNRMGGFEWDIDNDRIHFDLAAQRVLDMPPGYVDSEPAALVSRMPRREAARIDDTISEALREGRAAWSVYFRLRRADGTRGWIHAQGRIVRDGCSRPRWVIGVVRDAGHEVDQVAEELMTDDAGRRQQDVIREVAEGLSQAITVHDVMRALTNRRRMGLLGIVSLAIGLVEGDRIRIAAEGQPGTWIPELQYTRIDDDYPMSETLRKLEPLFMTSGAEFARRFPKLWPYIEALQASAAAYLPLVVEGRSIGALGFLYRDKHDFSTQERNLLITITSSIAQSLQRATLFDQEHDIAQGLQRAMLPRTIPTVPGTRIAVRYRSARLARDIGGDWYDVVMIPGGRVAAIIGDVQGHDTHAAAIMGQLRIALRAYAAEGHSPATVMARASIFLCDLDTDRFATCLYVQLDPATGTMVIVNAGHLSPLMRRPNGVTPQLPTVGGLPLGLSAQFGALDYPVTSAELEPGATLLMFSDGLVERPGADLGDETEALARTLSRGPQDVQQLADHLCRAMSEPSVDDDMALLLMRRDVDVSPPLSRHLHQYVGPADPEALTAARSLVQEALTAWGLPDRVDDAVLVADELITNALVHTRGGAVLAMRLVDLDGPRCRLRLEVQDLDSGWPRRRDPGMGELTGRGLILVHELSDAWGVESHGSGKSVWSEFRATGM